MMISGISTKQRDIFCRVTGFTSDFLSFIVVEHMRFSHGVLHLQWVKMSKMVNRDIATITVISYYGSQCI